MILDKVKKRVYKINDINFEINLKAGTVSNKFDLIVDFIHELENFHEDKFRDWYITLLNDCVNEENRFEVINNNIENIISYVDDFFDNENFDYSKFVNYSKVKKNSILFEKEELEDIQRVSSYLKLYAPIFNSKELKLSEKLHNRIFSKLTNLIVNKNSDVVSKLFEVIKSKSYRLTLTDRSMWDYLFATKCITPDTNILSIFNFVMNDILVLCKRDTNPIIFFTTVIDQSLKWFLRSVYTECYIYNDAISSEDIYSNPSVNNLKAYCYNDTIGRLVSFAYPILDQISDDNLNDIDKILINVEYVSPLVECVVYPLLSQALDIPYEHFTTLAPKYAALLSLFMSYILQNVTDEYPTLVKMLKLYPNQLPPMKTTYKLKDLNSFLNKYDNFLGFKSVKKLFDIISSYVGRTNSCSFSDLFNGKPVYNIPSAKIETELINLLGKNFSNQLNDLIEKIRIKVYQFF